MAEDHGDVRGFVAQCTRSLSAPPESAFDAWTDPELLAAWLGFRESGGDRTPRLVGVDNVDVAPRKGAPFRLDMITRDPDGTLQTWVHEGRVVESVRPGRLAITWISDGTEQRPTLLALEFGPGPEGGSKLRLSHKGFRTEEMAQRHAEGWDVLLELLSEATATAASAGVQFTYAWLRERFKERQSEG